MKAPCWLANRGFGAFGGRKISCPVLVLWGTRGSFGARWDALAIWLEWAEDVRGRAIESGHFLAEEAPDATYSELHAFFTAE
jgi:haloacetate dehalogenase